MPDISEIEARRPEGAKPRGLGGLRAQTQIDPTVRSHQHKPGERQMQRGNRPGRVCPKTRNRNPDEPQGEAEKVGLRYASTALRTRASDWV